MTIKPAVLLVAALLCMPAWAINKCNGPDGKAVFQDAPCAGTGITVAEDIEQKKKAAQVKAAPAKPSVPSSYEMPSQVSIQEDVQRRVQAATKEADATLARARANCKKEIAEYPVIGMTEADFKNCTNFGLMVKPETVNETETAAGVTRQYVYRNHHWVRFLYTRNGIVTAIQR